MGWATYSGVQHQARTGNGNAQTRLRGLGRAYQAFARQDSCGYRLMFQEARLLSDPDPELKAVMNRAFEELRLMVEECKAASILKPGDPVFPPGH